ncbi:kinase-like protein [Lophiostoma macrostomum CBS 122681]|uniref:Kinase-like protein n=1 Tax=Lophiostoma macrostomum CBS 122681 TaxID=1314788 RepID=A0A6A6TH90_9PLEO|nr:kinase-like protein [Lophiostoma macrostomum CBS 122681]
MKQVSHDNSSLGTCASASFVLFLSECLPAAASIATIVSSDSCELGSDEYDIDEYAEPYKGYVKGLYYPVEIGEELDEKYVVEHKLGHGGFSTVWMARDKTTSKLVALKIGVGRATETEIAMQTELGTSVANLLALQAVFNLQGKDEQCHRVLVYPLLGPSLQSCLGKMPMQYRMNAAKQLLCAIASLHEKGIVHRDLNSANVLWHATTPEYSKPAKTLSLPSSSWKPGVRTLPLEFPTSLVKKDISLGDLGLAIKAGTSVSMKVQSPAAYCAPERFHDVNPSYASDVWSFMCLFAELYTGVIPFPGPGGKMVSMYIVLGLGPMPATWEGKYNGGGEADSRWYDPRTTTEPVRTIQGLLERTRPEADQTERNLVESVLMKGFCYLPEQRISAAALMTDPAFNAVMDKYGVS